MATLVFTAVGTALGGPVGGAIGSLLGQSFDQQLFGSARRGPRLGDLGVQTSTYGTQIPRIYGTMRVAGTVIWATDVQESSTQTGAKGQPDTTVYSYSVSLAVALSSRMAGTVKRIWADGKLLRGAAGDFKVSTGFRYYAGIEDQAIDPLIGSIEGVSQTPAYRGLAIAVFENLELAEYGNRIPFLTFEVEADAGPVAISTILADASQARIEQQSPVTVGGFAAYGLTMRSALEPLIDHWATDLFDDGAVLRSARPAPAIPVALSDLGSSAGSERSPPTERSQVAARALPSSLTLSYYDASRDFQTSQMRGSVGEAAGREDAMELPVVIEASAAKALVETAIAKRWSSRDRLKLRLPPRFISLRPGSTITLPSSPSAWTVEQVMVDGLAVQVQLRPASQRVDAVGADAGRTVTTNDTPAAATSMALFELPDLMDGPDGQALYLAASSSADRWQSVPVEIVAGESTSLIRTASRKTVLGTAQGLRPPDQPFLIDHSNSLVVQLADQSQWLESCDVMAMVHGANLAIVGQELLQYGKSEPLGSGRFRLTELLRGRRGTEWAMDTHVAGEPFAMVDPQAMQRISLPASLQGAVVQARARGLADVDSPLVSKLVRGEFLKPPSPVHVKARFNAGGDLEVSWTRRSRIGWTWLDEVDVALAESREMYRVSLEGDGWRIDLETPVPTVVILESELAAAGPGSAILTVRQLGDYAASRPATAIIPLP